MYGAATIVYIHVEPSQEAVTMAEKKDRKRAGRVREQAVVYLERGDRELLDEMAERTGLPRTELFRRGLRLLAGEVLQERKPGSSLVYLVDTAADDAFPPDVAERADYYLYGGGYQERGKRRRAGAD
jgi:hypothetical protein